MKYLKKINESVEDKNITIVSGDDWQGLYLNGELLDQGHSANLREVLKSLGYNVENIYIEQEEIWEELGNSCPNDLDHVKTVLASKKFNL